MADDQSRFVVTLVHGTFARKARWTQPDSALCTALAKRFGDRVLIERMKWSGANTFGARRDAAAELRAQVLKNPPDLDDPRHIVIAHSHAGNIVTYAAVDAEVNRKIAGIVTLATPFIVARARNLGQTGKVAPLAFAVAASLLALYVTAIIWPELWGGWLNWQQILVIIAAVLLVQLPLMLLLMRWSAFGERMLAELQHGTIERERLLIVRAVADEATGMITFAQFPSLATTLVFGALARFTDGYVQWCVQLMQRRFLAVLFAIGGVIFSVLVLAGLSWLAGWGLLSLTAYVVSMCFTLGPFIALFQGSPFSLMFARLFAAGPLALLLTPVVMILFVTSLALGPRFALANLYLDVSVEATPVGHYDVILVNPPVAGDPDTPGGILHSALYEDARTIEAICDFIARRVGQP